LAVQVFWELAPLLVAMLILVACSAFFSASEAALFSLRASERNRLKSGSKSQQLAFQLLQDPDRLLSAVLFCNLVVNIAYFALTSLVGLRLQRHASRGTTLFATFTIGSLLVIIFFSEMLPKTLAVLKAGRLSAWVSWPLSFAVRAVDPLLPGLRIVNLLSRRLIWPTFHPETYLQVTDLERAIELSTSDAQLLDQERAVLRNLVSLSDLRVDECMRPRSQLLMRRPPVSWEDIREEYPRQTALYVTEPDSDEIVATVDLKQMYHCPEQNLEHYAERVLYAPWCATVADVLQMMEDKDRAAVAVVNELGETIGVVLHGDVLDVVFTSRPSRSERLLNREPLLPLAAGEWQATGLTNLRALEQHFRITLPDTASVTVAGVIQECLQRLPVVGDRCVWGPFVLEVTESPSEGPLIVRLRWATQQPEDST
jgi:Mg2+/Co2+ transporter CorB